MSADSWNIHPHYSVATILHYILAFIYTSQISIYIMHRFRITLLLSVSKVYMCLLTIPVSRRYFHLVFYVAWPLIFNYVSGLPSNLLLFSLLLLWLGWLLPLNLSWHWKKHASHCLSSLFQVFSQLTMLFCSAQPQAPQDDTLNSTHC